MGTRTKESKKRVYTLFLLIAITSVLFIMTTYAWFTTQKDVTISNLRGKVEVAETLEISLDAKTWGHEIDLSEVSLKTEAYAGNRNWLPEEMFPVSCSGETNTQSLLMYRGKYKGLKLTEIEDVQGNENKDLKVDSAKYPGYFAFDIFLRNLTKQDGKDVKNGENLFLNSNSYAWVIDSKEGVDFEGNKRKGSSKSGLQNTLRVAFARYGNGSATADVIPATANQAEILARANSQSINSSSEDSITIWEPNANLHTEDVCNSVKIKVNEGETPLTGSTIEKITEGELEGFYKDKKTFFTRTINKNLVNATISNVYDWSGTYSFSKPETIQTSTVFKTVDKSEAPHLAQEKIPYIEEGAVELPLIIAADSITKVRVYIWMEGQDPDCTVLSSTGGGIEVQIGLAKGIEEEDISKRKTETTE